MKATKTLQNISRLGWNDIIKYHKNPPLNQTSFPRHPYIQKKYDTNKANGCNDNLEHRIFSNWDIFYKMTLNDYPYYITPDIEHKVLWFNPKFTQNNEIERLVTNDNIIDVILKMEEQGNEYIFYRNHKFNSSVPNIIHYQVFVKRRIN